MRFVPKLSIGTGITGALLTICLWLAVMIGWGSNIMKLIPLAQDPALQEHMGIFVVRIIGIFVFPLGSILGWCT